MIQKLNTQIGYKSPAASSIMNAALRKIDEIIDAINSGDIPGSEPGEDAFSATLSNESQTISTDADGKVITSTIVLTKMSVYSGTSPLSLNSLITNHPEIAKTDAKTGSVNINLAKGYDLSSPLVITITGICSRGTISKVLTINGANKGEQGDGIVNVGEWEDGMFVPYLGMVSCDGVTYQCINKSGSYKRPFIIDWSLTFYLTDADGYRIRDSEGNLILVGEDGEDEYVVVAGSALQLGLSETSFNIACTRGLDNSVTVFDDFEASVSPFGFSGDVPVQVSVSDIVTADGCNAEMDGDSEILIYVPKGTVLKKNDPILTCSITCDINGVKTTRQCSVSFIADYGYEQLHKDIAGKIDRESLSDELSKIKDEISLGGITIKDGNITIKDETGDGGITIHKGGIVVTSVEGTGAVKTTKQVEITSKSICGASPQATCDSSENVGGTPVLSDRRLKENLNDIVLPVDSIADAPLHTFNLIGSENKRLVGTIAQYWENILPESVDKGSDGYLRMKYAEAAMVAVVSLARKVRELEQEIQTLKGR
ncbi:MAG: tail fiber domain-containing protein [Paludibacteraceae bacterium]|nr:tail fiber domain-containing protein [Paludibacteraceae bacterium]